MSNMYPVPERGHVYRHCVMCGRPFRVCNSQLARRGARFCTVRCYHAALRAFSEALASDRLGLVLGRALQKAKVDAILHSKDLSNADKVDQLRLLIPADVARLLPSLSIRNCSYCVT